MGAKDLQKKLKKKKNKDGDSQTMNSNFVQDEKFPKIDECHLSYHKDESNNPNGEKKKSKSRKQKRKSNALAESSGVDQSNEIEDGIGQENIISSEPGNQETRKSRRKKRKCDKRAGKAEADGVPKRQGAIQRGQQHCGEGSSIFSS
ncbi:hypothetical protein HAX54_051557 [Datura stramonium]|uniref:Uncharacterized protein n=1 Tax=Datura stramonium TaxID=4076 RepID=A0ABS8SYL6_DATST|nr:hypothetical protein [Datura stramonium]